MSYYLYTEASEIAISAKLVIIYQNNTYTYTTRRYLTEIEEELSCAEKEILAYEFGLAVFASEINANSINANSVVHVVDSLYVAYSQQ